MARKPAASAKKIGRPPTIGAAGETVLIAQRLPAALVERINAWGKARSIGRSEAVRQLVELGLGKPGRAKRS